MGTWAVGSFGNDFAQDWAQDLQESHDLYFIEETLNNVLQAETTEYLEAPFGAEALAAVDTLARLMGRGGKVDEDSTLVDDWVQQMAPKFKLRADLAEKARRALALVLSESSELRELWQDSEHYADWQADVQALSARMAP